MLKVGELRFNNLPIEVVTANSIRPIYIKEGDKIPKKYDNHYFDFIDGYLCDLDTNEKVVLNAKVAGTERTISMTGNKLQNLAYSKSSGDKSKVIKIKKRLQEYFLENLNEKIKFTRYPIYIELKFYVNMSVMMPDRDNLAVFYEKAFFDCIQDKIRNTERQIVPNIKGFIPNDDLTHINSARSTVFFTDRSPYLVANFFEYEEGEYEKDKANINLDQTITESVQKLSEKFAKESFELKYMDKEVIYNSDGEMKEKYLNLWQKEYDSYFKILSNEFL